MDIIKKLAALLTAACMMTAFAAEASAACDPVTREEISASVTKSGASGLKRVNGRVYTFKNGNGTPYTGRLKSSTGTQYCVDGSIWFGWIKIGTAWYYFSPDENGIMATGKYKTATGVYQFDSTGVWTGSCTKTSKANKDFSIKYEALTDDGYICLDTASKTLVNAPVQDEADNYVTSVSITAKDKQIMYEMFMECELNSMRSELDYGGDGFIAVTAKLSGGEFNAMTGSDSYSAYKKDADVRTFSYFTAFLDNYIRNMPEYVLSVQNKEGSEMGEVITDVKMLRYKSSSYGMTKTNTNADLIFTTRREVRSFVNDVLYVRKRSKFSFIKKLLSYDDKFFEDHVVLYSETLLPQTAVTSPGQVIYDPEQSLYTAALNVKKASGKASKQFVVITEAKRSKNETMAPSGKTVFNKI